MTTPRSTRPRVLAAVLATAWCATAPVGKAQPSSSEAAEVTKLKDFVVYRDDSFYSAFPSVVRRRDGELIVAFRRAPELRLFGSTSVTHTDASSQIVLVRSQDDGATWTAEPQIVAAHPRGGLQDPSLIQLADDSILCASYGWARIPAVAGEKLKNPMRLGDFVFMGGVLYRSEDRGYHWTELEPPPTFGEARLGLFNQPLPAYNRGAMHQSANGRVYWVTAMASIGGGTATGTHLLTSDDRGTSWRYACPVAVDEAVSFNEASLYETPRGDLVAFLRTDGFAGKTVMVRSVDGGRSFEKWQDVGFRGHPHFLLRLPDQRVLLVYGYRYKPFGIRARVLDAECMNAGTATEVVLRDDGGSGDLGYPWATMVGRDRVLVVYYFNEQQGTRFIGGTLLRVGAAPQTHPQRPDGPNSVR